MSALVAAERPLDLGPLAARDVADLEDAVDEQPEPELGRNAPGRDVRRIEQAELLEILHHVADGRRRHALAQRAGQRARADRLAGREIGLDQPAKHLAAALVHLGQRRAEGAQRAAFRQGRRKT